MSDLLGKSKKGFKWDLLGSFVNQVFNLGISIVLARLLSPQEFGIVGIALVFTSLTEVFTDVGFSSGIIYKQKLDDKAYSSVFYINISLSVVFAAIIFFSAPYIGGFYSDDDISTVLRYLAIVPIIAALGKVHSAILVKDLDFKSLTIRDVIAKVLGGVTGIIAALNNFGVFSLVIQHIVAAISGTFMLWFRSRWIPRLTFSWNSVRSITSYSIYVFFENLIRRLFIRLDTLAIGKFFSPAVLGFYSRAESLNSQVATYSSNSLRKIAFPLLSSIQDDERFQAIFFKLLAASCIAVTYLAGGLLIFADEIILLLFGPQWGPSIIIFKILLYKVAISPFGALLGATLLSKGLSKLKFKISLIQRVVLITPILIAIFYDSIEYFSIAVVIAFLIGILISSYWTFVVIEISFKYQMRLLLSTILPLISISIFSYHFTNVPKVLTLFLFLILYTGFLFVALKTEFLYLLNQVISLYKSLKRT